VIVASPITRPIEKTPPRSRFGGGSGGFEPRSLTAGRAFFLDDTARLSGADRSLAPIFHRDRLAAGPARPRGPRRALADAPTGAALVDAADRGRGGSRRRS
jgi:hypothetical protein